MPKSIVDVDVNTEEFKEFQTLFEKYQAQVQKLPGAWGNINKEVQSGFEAATAALLAQSELNRRSQQAAKDQTNKAKEQASYWKSTATSTAAVANNLYRATQSLVRWAGLATELGGLIGLGGLWGLDRLASGVGAGRQANQGLGLSQGERTAFGLNYGRITDNPNAFLGDVNQALHDPAQVSHLYAAGLNQQQMSGDTAQAAVALMEQYRQLALQQKAVDPLGQTDASVLQAHGGLMSLQDFELLKGMSNKEYGEITGKYNVDKNKLGLGDPMMKQWQDFDNQLATAGQQIKNAFIVGLTPLTPQLTHLSQVVADATVGFMDWVDKSKVIDKMAGGIGWLADTLGDPKNQEKIKANLMLLGDDVMAAASWVHNALVKLGVVKDAAAAGGALGVAQAVKKSIQTENPEVFGPWAGLLPAIALAESGKTGGFNKDGSVLVSKEGARGKYQLMPNTAKGLGVNPDNPADAAYGAATLFGQLAVRYDNDPVKMIAAYNWTPWRIGKNGKPEGVDVDIAKNGADWYKHLPKETNDYLKKVLGNKDAFGSQDTYLPGKITPAVRLEIYNFTGADVVTTAGQAAK